MTRTDPYMLFRFRVEIEGLQVGGFSEATGISFTIANGAKFTEGGSNVTHTFPTEVTYSNIVLKRGLASTELWQWFLDTANGTLVKRTVTIALFDGNQNDVWTWTFNKAYPVKWTGPALKADSFGASALAVETIELAHSGLSAIYTPPTA